MTDSKKIDAIVKAITDIECTKCQLLNKWMESIAVKNLQREVRKLQRENMKLHNKVKRLIKKLNSIGVVE
jgi:hypothetical protein